MRRPRAGAAPPQRPPADLVQEADRGGARARLPVARSRRRCRPPAWSGSSTARTTRTCSSRACTSWPTPTRSSVATARSTTSRRASSTTAPWCSSASCTCRARSRASGCWPAWTTPTSSGSSSPATSTSARRWDDYRKAYEVALERCNTEAAPWYVVPSDSKWYRNWAVGQLLLEALRGMQLEWPEPGLRRRGAEAPGCTVRPLVRRVRATRYVTPLREGGSLPGRGRGRRPRHLRLQVPRCRPGPARARGRGGRRRAWPRLVDVPVPDLVTVDLAPEIGRYEADEEVQDLLNRSLGLNLGVDLLPGAFGYDASYEPDRELAGRILWLDALVRQRRPLVAQPEPAGLARRPVRDRPRRGALLPPRLARAALGRGAGAAVRRASPTTPASTSCAATPPRPSAQDDDLAARLTADGAGGGRWPRCPTSGSSRCRARRRPTTLRRRYVAYLLARRRRCPRRGCRAEAVA